jgi:hypothetical protein
MRENDRLAHLARLRNLSLWMAPLNLQRERLPVNSFFACDLEKLEAQLLFAE